ncbi:sulfate adenylyltransferase subunit CysD [Achromobacter denitrificans]|uniref:sulfate adenylyltransferase subunit CysD n=1 Tax=Achromobacter denitrificans TaxID=32002 RepID=UPI000F6875BC|nr:sulfate adenylyltransferase subunit CysD [Achromobacter denitrificans]RSE89148.1 sulfate adenylyltransferase subunit CysD [Achromobacter denitrificans]
MSDSLFGMDLPGVWDTESAFQRLRERGQAESKRTAERRLHELGVLPPVLQAADLRDENGRQPVPVVIDHELHAARSKRKLILFAQLADLTPEVLTLSLNDARGARYWVNVDKRDTSSGSALEQALQALAGYLGKPAAVFPHGQLVALCRSLPAVAEIEVCLLGYPPVLSPLPSRSAAQAATITPHLQRLEAESIHIIREAVAEAANPAMLYSVGKDSSVMLHLARKAFYPAPPPFPLLHVDTRWKFQEMYLFRDQMAKESGMDLIVHVNPEAIAKNINPFDHGSALHTDITKTEGLKQALDKFKFDVVFGGARRDEEKSRAKERIFSFRTRSHRWDPKSQRPELWNLYNARKGPGESLRVFPLSNWTEMDIWHYIYSEQIPVVPLYFAKERPVVRRDGMIIMVDDDRMRLLEGEHVEKARIRFRTLGCYPLTGAVESEAATLPEIMLELLGTRSSERQGRAIDSDAAASMEKKKQEGYF